VSLSLGRAALREAQELLDALNMAPATLAGTGPAAFILKTGDWVFVEWDEKSGEHVMVDPE